MTGKACGRIDPHTCTAHAPVPTCQHCGAPDVLRGDGGMALVCPRCLLALGRIAAEPYAYPVPVRERMQARSADVLDLMGGRWVWTGAGWPGVVR